MKINLEKKEKIIEWEKYNFGNINLMNSEIISLNDFWKKIDWFYSEAPLYLRKLGINYIYNRETKEIIYGFDEGSLFDYINERRLGERTSS